MTYLDHAATSPLLPSVREAMAAWWDQPLNPSSVHAAGQRAAAAVERAREQVAEALGRPPSGVVFTSSATEANHQAIRGHAAQGARTVAVSGLEHPCVAGAIAGGGLEVRPLPVGASGRAEVAGAKADLCCLMAVNHETGVVQDVASARGVAPRLHVDASAALGRCLPDLWAAADSVVASAHKIGGPVGVGVLSLTSGEPFPALLTGGRQERGRRAGTVDVVGIVGFAAACAAAVAERAERHARWTALRERIVGGLRACEARIVGEAGPVIPSVVCGVFDDVPGELLVQALDLRGIAVSSGAACASGSVEPSPVLVAMGDDHPEGALRVSLGPASTSSDVDHLLAVLPEVVRALRDG